MKSLPVEPVPAPVVTDRRRLRSARTRHAILEAYMSLLREKPQIPQATQIAERAGCSLRSVFERFPDLHTLRIAVMDHALTQGAPEVFAREVVGDRQQRLRIHVKTRAMVCERWLPLWQAVVVNQADSDELRARTALVRQAVVDRIEVAYKAELSTLSDSSHRNVVIAIKSLIAFESWAQMREDDGLDVDQACAVWIEAIDRLLPPTPDC